MPEGDTIWRAARDLNAVLAGQELTRCDIRVPKFATTDFTGDTVQDVVSRGKHLLIRGGDPVDGWILHSHLKMEGLWHVYARGEKWRRPAFKARAVLETATHQVVGFDLGFLRVLARKDEEDAVGYLGPDLLGPDWDAQEALRRLRAEPERPIGLALLDQRIMAGIGNIYRCELCFLAGVHPLTPVSDVPDLPRLVDLSKRLLEVNKARPRRITTGAMGRDQLWVYNRERRGCLRCGTKVAHELLGDNELELRDLYYCPHCQPLRG
ncbi:Fpg/Nei family DNA glycosylase [Arthrobacter sp. zg-Y20]|uniref:Fpg/Nei family DNA glycosylase n=1 Tax=unclassified Arthrobacter TaxID=235627 RepID=UPI001D1592BD|nr:MULTISPECIES: DNA-formamidopyrimidine glycosylase family protein [unclassified Arthrobacter]MCC3276340.1 Fpg/Nei family DNA glycosylase [Arthrobacter sp. zg-Y20]MDK1316499.1 DNA-formamidopyrimidine glycosylase family protein [Arthrobacter sp. zg.Y20]WIB06541.1 DNA-formamidopyrimidine glycosylase family protein [Arthrobacter sp. zg-Y20]